MKVIIDIPEDAYKMCQDLKTNNDDGIVGLCAVNSIANGTPLDDVKKEIADIYCGQYCENPLTADAVREMILDILDNIGKVEKGE